MDPEASLKLIDFGHSFGASIDRGYVTMAGTLEHTAPETLPLSHEDGVK